VNVQILLSTDVRDTWTAVLCCWGWAGSKSALMALPSDCERLTVPEPLLERPQRISGGWAGYGCQRQYLKGLWQPG